MDTNNFPRFDLWDEKVYPHPDSTGTGNIINDFACMCYRETSKPGVEHVSRGACDSRSNKIAYGCILQDSHVFVNDI